MCEKVDTLGMRLGVSMISAQSYRGRLERRACLSMKPTCRNQDQETEKKGTL